MPSTIRCSVVLFAVSLAAADVEKTRWFNQTRDHFNAEDSGTFLQRYYVNTTYFKPRADGSTPIFFIPGGEWDLGPTKGILYGMAHDLAQENGGLMVAGEHRFYGESLPRGPTDSFLAEPSGLGLLSLEQAMADYAAIIASVKAEFKCEECPVVALGGSYSGKLSAYMRLKYPFHVNIALAASAPIYLDSVGLTDSTAYYKVVEDATAKISPKCPAAVKAGLTAYLALPSASKAAAVGLCATPAPPEFGWDELAFYVTQFFATKAMFNYPPSTSPLAAACGHVLGSAADTEPATDGLKRLLLSLAGNATCFDLAAQSAGDVPAGGASLPAGSKGSVACSDWSGCGAGVGGRSWDYMACSEVTQPLGIAEDSKMFPPHPWTEEWMTSHCHRRFGLAKPGFEHIRQTMGLDDITRWPQPARVIFSNGMQDPWSAGGVAENKTATMIAIQIPNGAHHQDLNGGASSSDTPDMLAARAQERTIIRGWLADLAADKKSVQ